MRRQVISHDDWARPEYGDIGTMMSTPRKWRTYNYTKSGQDTIQYISPSPVLDHPYLGRKFVQWDGQRLERNYNADKSIIHEFDVARDLRGNIYRILWARYDPELQYYLMVSKPSIEYRIGRLNLVINSANMQVLQIYYG